MKGRFSTGVGKRIKLFTIFALHGVYNHRFLFCQFFHVSKDTSLKSLYGIKKVCCPRNSHNIIFKNKNCWLHFGKTFKGRGPNSFALKFRLYISPEVDCIILYWVIPRMTFSSKYNFPLWSTLGEHDRRAQSNIEIFFFI